MHDERTDADTFEQRLDKYIDVILRLGVNIQPGQVLIIQGAQYTIADTVRRIGRRAFELGAHDVHVFWGDERFDRIRVDLAPESALSEVPEWRIRWLHELADGGAAYLRLNQPDPDVFAGVDARRFATVLQAGAKASESFGARIGAMEIPWAIVGVPTPSWAARVFPDLPDDQALAALWHYIFHVTRADTPDPLAAWHEHIARLQARADWLNRYHFARLRYSGPGTDLTVGLPERHVWISAGSQTNKHGVSFVPNLPTEEAFTSPQRDAVWGRVQSTMPLNYNGVLVRGMWVRFERGRIVEFGADEGADALRGLIETDEGSHYLGEVALVSDDAPTNVGYPIYNTLYDENAACHLAIGRGFPVCVEGGVQMSPDELTAQGVNQSLVHTDFMVGSSRLDVDGETTEGERVPILRAGLWAPDEGR